MVIGAVVLALGYALLWIPLEQCPLPLYCALGVIIVGNGFFKPNAGNLVRKIYEGDDIRIDSAFTIYYMAVNIGSMISMTATPWIRDYVGERYGDAMGWHTAFGVCSIGLVLGLVNYALMRRTLAQSARQPTIDAGRLKPRAGRARWRSLAMVFIAAFILQSETGGAGLRLRGRRGDPGHLRAPDPQQRAGERAGLIAALVLTVQTIFFFIFYQQMSTSLNLFAQQQRGPVVQRLRRRTCSPGSRSSTRTSTRSGS